MEDPEREMKGDIGRELVWGDNSQILPSSEEGSGYPNSTSLKDSNIIHPKIRMNKNF